MIGKKIRRDQRDAFFKTLAETGIVAGACHVSGIARRTAEKLREVDVDWAADWADADKDANDHIRTEIHRRAVKGVTRVAFGPRGIIIGADGDPLEVTEYSDRLLEMLARARMQLEFGDMAKTVIPALPADLQPDPAPVPDEAGPEKPIL